MSPASQQQIESQLRNLISKLPLREQRKWLPRKHVVHHNLRNDIQDLLRTNPKLTFTTRQLATHFSNTRSAEISSGSIEYHLAKLMATQDVYRTDAQGTNGCRWAYGARAILHLTCVDAADLEVKRRFIDIEGVAYELSLDPFGQTRWVYSHQGRWLRVPGDIKLVLS